MDLVRKEEANLFISVNNSPIHLFKTHLIRRIFSEFAVISKIL